MCLLKTANLHANVYVACILSGAVQLDAELIHVNAGKRAHPLAVVANAIM